jgi:hypothetical protein
MATIKQDIGGITVYVPTGEADTATGKLAQRLETVRGARIGILDNCKEFADLVLKGVAEALERDHGVKEVRFWRKNYLGVPSPYATEMAAECDAVINGVGH